jgi:hypothetical protein
MFGIITPGKGGFRSSSLVFWSHKTQHISRPISGLTPFYHAEITIPLPSFILRCDYSRPQDVAHVQQAVSSSAAPATACARCPSRAAPARCAACRPPPPRAAPPRGEVQYLTRRGGRGGREGGGRDRNLEIRAAWPSEGGELPNYTCFDKLPVSAFTRRFPTPRHADPTSSVSASGRAVSPGAPS